MLVANASIGSGIRFPVPVCLAQTSRRASCFNIFSVVYLHQGQRRVKRAAYFGTDGESLTRLSEAFTVLSTSSNVQLSRYNDPFEHPYKLHSLSSTGDPAQITLELLTWLSGAPGYGRSPAFGGFPGGSAPPGMGAPPGTGRPQSLRFDSVC